MHSLDAWKSVPKRRPLLVQGARQVGKTWLVKEFAARSFDGLAYVDFLHDETMRAVFEGSLDPDCLLDAFSERYTDRLRRYYYVGGMPEAVQEFADTGDYATVRMVQNRLLYDYEHDFSRHTTPTLMERIRLVWRSVPGQLARENKKFGWDTASSIGFTVFSSTVYLRSGDLVFRTALTGN